MATRPRELGLGAGPGAVPLAPPPPAASELTTQDTRTDARGPRLARPRRPRTLSFIPPSTLGVPQRRPRRATTLPSIGFEPYQDDIWIMDPNAPKHDKL
jgi:hypothetical protein